MPEPAWSADALEIAQRFVYFRHARKRVRVSADYLSEARDLMLVYYADEHCLFGVRIAALGADYRGAVAQFTYYLIGYLPGMSGYHFHLQRALAAL